MTNSRDTIEPWILKVRLLEARIEFLEETLLKISKEGDLETIEMLCLEGFATEKENK
jgi:hypothetical protein